MSAVKELLDVLDSKGVKLGLSGQDGLRIRGDKQSLNDYLIENIKRHKEQLVAVLKARIPFALLTEAERSGVDQDVYEDAYPLSALQAGMVFHTEREQFNGVYHDMVADHVKCPWDQASFEQALAACVEEHPVLRTVFRLDGERPLQLVCREVELPLEIVDLREHIDPESYVREWIEARKRHVFDWERGPLWQLNIFLRTEESFQFVLSFHHAVLDGWSRAVLTTELYNRYQQLLLGQEAEAVATDWTYRDFIAQEQRVLADEAAREYFARLLEDAPSEQLPRQQAVSTAVAHESIVLEGFAPRSRQLLELARELGVPVQAVLLAGHFKVLATLSGQTKALSCVTHNGRPETAGAERSLGLYLNSLPQALELGTGSWRDLISEVARLNAASMSYRGYPLSQVQQETGLVLNEVTFNYTHFHVFAEMASDSIQQVEVLSSSAFEQTNFDFHVDVMRWLSDDSLSMTLIYNPELYERELIERVSGYYQRAYEQLLSGLDQPHQAQSLLSAAELEQVEAAAHGPAVGYAPQCIHEVIRAQAQRTPEAVAVVYGEQRLSYAELDARSDRLASYLVAVGVGVESRVGLYLRRTPELLIGVLGVLKAGAAYVPLEPGLPAERVSYMLGDAGVEWVLVESEQMAELPLSGVDVVLMDGAGTDPEWLAESDELEEVTPVVGSEQLAYILYTSGSTGRPKGVMVEHGGLAHYLGHAVASYLTNELEGSVVSSPLSFDATLTTLLAPLLAGRRVELLADDETLMAQLAERLFAAAGNKLFKLTPAHLEALQYVERPQAVGHAAHVLVLGGEQLSAGLLRRWKQELLPEAQFVNEYGPTEAVVGCSVWWLRDESELGQLTGLTAAPIGRPIGNTELYVLGAERQLLPWRSVGELYIGGAGVARGYLNQAELTAARFIDNPFGSGRLYRTGDLVRWLASGELQFVGRRDEQVKLRGYRVELGEIEQQLETVAGVKAAVVLAREDEPGRKRLVAYVAVNGERERAGEWSNQLRQELQTRLPEYMVPTEFVLLDELPLTPNGKVDRRALPAPAGESQQAEYVAPRNAVEQALCEVWQEVLKRERVGIEDNFFSLGGDSILSIRVVALLKGRGIALGINDIFQHQTIGLLAAQARAVESEGAALEPFALLTEAERAELADSYIYEDAYPMSTLQTGMVFHTQLEQFSGVYHDIVVEHVKCAWDQPSFEQALYACIDEHPVLRTVFRLDGERPLQLVRRAVELPLEVVDLRAEAEAEQQVQDWVEARKRHVFDWERGPLWQLNIFLRTEESFQFVLSFHHAVLDGWSRAVLTTELYNRYQQLLQDQEPTPVSTDWTYRDFIAQEQRVLADEAAREYFARLLEGAPSEQLPRQQPVSTGGQPHESILIEEFQPLSGHLLGVARELGVPIQAVLLAGHFKVLSTLSGQTKALSCVTHNGRPETAGGERSLGLYLNSLPQALELGGGSWRELINEVARLNAASMSYRGYPLSQVQQETGLVLNEVTFNYTHYHVFGELTETGQPFEVLGSFGFEQTNFDFHVDVARGLGDDSLRLLLIYNPELYERELIERVSGYYQRAYEQLLSGLDQPHQAQSLLSAAEIEQVETAAHGPAVGYAPQCVHEQIREQAQRTPEAVAVVYGEQWLSYAELDARSDRLARYLVAAGVGVESRVGLYLRRTPELLIGVLGVLKAGAAYVPLEPGLPAERVSYMLGDAGVEWVLVESAQMAELPLSGVDVVLMDGAGTDPEWLADGGELDKVTPAVGSEQLAYILYTSGSTGRPKGVMVEHGGLAHYLGHAAASYLTNELEGSVVSSPLSFDATLTTLLAPLLAGRRVELLADDETLMAQLAERLFAAAGNKLFKLTPAHLEALQYVERPQAVGHAAHVLVLGGEQLSAGLLRHWKQELLPEAQFVNEYGPTEAVVGCSVWWLRDESELGQLTGLTAVPIGRPIGNTELYVLGAERQLLPWRSVGELYIGGAGVARGYLNQAELTAARFIDNPFGSGRLYRTGDLVRWLSSGELQFVGRSDEQVKLRGYRVELGEIEQQLETVAGVKAAVVLAREDEPGRKRLVAYVVPDEYPADEEAQTLLQPSLVSWYRDELALRLPHYMVPTDFVLLAELPLTPNGKVDRRALPVPDGASVSAEYVAPRNAVEQALCEVWQEVLNRDQIGIEDNFFSLGGDSILSIRVVALLKGRGIALGINDIFQHQTIGLLAAQARAVESEGAALEPFVLLTEAERAELADSYIYEDAYPMSTLQTGMVFHTQLEQFSGVYHDIVVEHVKCAWDQPSFEQALYACIEAHPVLRTVFRLDGERPLQLVHRAVELPLAVVDLRAEAEAEQYVQDWVEARKRHVFDWEQGPLWQLNIFLRTEESFQFVLSFHHAVLDGWSRAVLTTELYNRYQQLLQGQEAEPVTTDWTYRDFIAQEQRVLADEAAREYFARLLEDAPSEQLPRQQAVSTSKQPNESIVIEEFRPLSTELLELARELGVPVQAVLLAGHLKVLSTLSGQTKALSCVTHSGRPESAGAERSLGLYLNSLPQALELGGGSWRELINEVARLNAASMSYRGYPLSQVQQETGLVLNEVTFNYTHFHVFAELTSETTQQVEVLGSSAFEQTNFDFHVDVTRWPGEETLSLMLIYNPELYERELIERVSGYYQRAYEQLLSGLDQPHQAQSLLSAAELEQVAAAAHGPAVAYAPQCVHEQIREQAQRTPEAVAVVYGEQRLSYAELDARSDRLARYLVAAGVGVESRVGLYLRRTPELLIGVLGVLKAGAAYVPLEPGLPAERVSYMLGDAGVEWVLVESEQMAELPLGGVDVVLMDGASTDPEWLAEAGHEEQEPVPVSSEQLAYILYTSGSTGRPKGVMVEHGGLAHYLGHAAANYLTNELEGSVVSSPLSFDATLTTLLAPLLAGRRVELLADDETLMAQLAERLFAAAGNKLFKLTPAHLEALQYVERAQAVGGAAHVLVLGGEQLSAGLLRRWKQELLPEAQFVNEYGPTEAVVGCSVWWLRDESELGQLTGLTAAPIGRPIGNTELYVLGAERQLLPWRSVGELYIGGAGVARGYLNQAELTAARFIDNPFGSGRLYRTGDLVRWLSSGELQFVGRRDEQVKLRGYRIELGEIEQQLETVAGVQAAVVLAREDEPGRKRLVAYVAVNGERERAGEWSNQLRQELQTRLPEYMVPTAFVLLAELPLTPNGKVDRRALPAPAGESQQAEYVAPRNAVEQALCEVWQEVLKRERVGIEDNFFSLGGDSILSIRVVALLKSRGIALGINDIFQHQTIGLLAAQARAVESEGAALEPFALLTEAERAELADSYIYEDAYPMSTLQTGMVFHTQLEQFSGVYHDIVVEHVKCAWDQPSFEQALYACIDEHPVLRTVFRLDGERPLQLVRRAVELPLEVVDLRAEAEAEQYVQDWVEARKRHVFDWERGPLWQLNIFLRTEESFQFVLSFHHAVLDGWSRAVLTTELYNRYQQLLQGPEPEPITTDWTYRDFIAQEQRVLADEAAREYFARLLEGAPSEQLPRQQPVSTGGQPHESIVIEEFRPLSTELLELARELGVPVQTVLLAGHFKVLATLSGQTKALSCVTHNGRPETAGGERSLGLYLNSLPQALELGGGSWRELINEVARLNAASMSYRGYPLSQVQQETGLVLNEVTFNYTHYHVFGELTETGQPFEVLGSFGFEQTNFDFHVDVARGLGDDSLRLLLIYNPELYERELIERVSGYYQRAYEQLLSGLDQPHQAQSLLSAAEIEQVEAAAHGPAVGYAPQCIHEVIREQAQRTPEAVAVVYGEQWLSYAELDARSDRLARYLVAAGVGVESRVGLYLRRAPELLIGVLGVLKAGAAYVPLEPGLPAERVSYMLGDAGVEWVLVESEQMAELPLSGVDVVLMDGASTDPEWLAESDELDEITPVVGSEQLAYILYTSGSTGRPKGVMVEHGGLAHYLGHAAASYLTNELEGSVVSSPLSFDATLTTLLAPLLAGRRVELLADDETLMAQLAERLFAAAGNKLFKLTPAHLEALQYVERPQAVGRAAHVLVLGGEQLSAGLLRHWKQELLPEAQFVNEYGPTEAVVGCSVWWLRDESELGQLAGLTAAPIGRPIGNTELYVLGAERQLLPWRSVGELYIGGAGVARGYLNQAELTAERFIDNPFGSGRLYRTGDLVRWLSSGELQFVGRSDEQVKLRGFRVELGEIEQQLETVAGVQAAVVLAREDEPGRKRLVAYVVPDEYPADEEAQALLQPSLVSWYRDELALRLPHYMVPTEFVLLAELPLTPNGKIDRRALPVPDGASVSAEYVAPRNAVEQTLCEVWQEVLNRDQIGIEDNFFSLGGDSILSIRVVALLKGRGIALGINDIFQHQTIGLLAAQARAVESEGAALEPFVLLTEAERAELADSYIYEDAYPMSTLQTGMVFHTQLEQFSGVYHDIVVEHVKCAWDQPSFEQALTACIEAHPVLRTVFRLDGERPLQLVRRAVELLLEVVDLRAEAEAEQYVQDWVEARKRHVFDWEQGPLWQLNIFLRTEESFQFVLSFHHAVLDGWSRAVLTTELYNRYQQLLQDQEPEPVTTDWTYRDFIAQEQRVLADEAARDYFARLLEDVPSEQLPRQQAVSTSKQPNESIFIEEFRPLSTELLGVARELGVPVQAVLLAGHFKVLATLSGQTKALSCVTHSGRPESAGAERSLGLYLNSLPQALELGGGSWRELINEVARLNAASMSYRGYPLSQVQQETGLVLNEVTFNYTHFHVFAELTSETAQQVEVLGSSAFEQTNFDFHVDVTRWPGEETLSLMLIYNPELYERELIERVRGYYQRAYEQLLTGLDQPHQAQSLLSAAELEQVAAAAHGPAVAYAPQCVHEQIREQAQQTPEAVAVVYGEQRLSYAELDARSDRLASYLVAAGVGVESRVGLYLRRTPELLIGVLGVLKAGAAYVPLEPGLPAERVSYMLGDAGVEWVLVESEQMAELPLSGVDVVLMDGASTDPEWLAEAGHEEQEPVPVSSEQLAYILYTSGSTGRPKGVMVEHGGLAHYLGHAAASYLTNELEGSVVSSPLSFDATLTTLLAPLLAGRRVELLADDETLMAQLAERLFAAAGNKLFKLTPAHLEALQYVERPEAVGGAAHVLVLGGEQLSAGLLRRWKQELLPEAQFVNEYGPTEAVVGCSVWWLREESELGQLTGLTAVPIGRPIGNTELYVLGAERQLLPWRSVGELYIGGAGVARGYLNQAELTAARFIESPFGSGRLYRTGDLVRWLSSGELLFVGRSDEQVKLRGYRVELGEIEQQLETVAGVKAAVVLAREDEPGRKRLVAYVAVNGERERAGEWSNQLRQELQTRLPEYMVPTEFVLLAELPLTPNGKVDRRALPAPEGESQQTEYVAPRNAVEQALCEVWQEVLKRERVGIEDNFFSLGGDSILSIRVVALLKSRGITLGINKIFQHQTVALLAAHVTQQADSLISKMSNEVAEQKVKWATAGKAIEEGIF